MWCTQDITFDELSIRRYHRQSCQVWLNYYLFRSAGVVGNSIRRYNLILLQIGLPSLVGGLNILCRNELIAHLLGHDAPPSIHPSSQT